MASSATCRFDYPTGRAGAVGLGDDVSVMDALPAASLAAFCGVGNPWALGAPHTGKTVLDIDCGAGMDRVVAAQGVGLTVAASLDTWSD